MPYGRSWGLVLYGLVLVGGTILVALAGLERALGVPIPRLKYSKPVRKERVYALVPAVIGLLVMGMPVWLLCSWSGSPRPASHIPIDPGFAIELCIVATGFAGAVGFLFFIMIWIGSAAWRMACRPILRSGRSDHL